MIINPLILPPIVMGLVAMQYGAPTPEAITVVLVATLGYLILPLGLLLVLRSKGRIKTIEARDRERRERPVLVGAAILSLWVMVMWMAAGSVRHPISGVALILAINIWIVSLITQRFKVSIHVSGVSGAFSILVCAAWLSGQPVPGGVGTLIGFGLAIPLVMWARVMDHAHARNEVLAGCAFGLLVSAIQVVVLFRLGWF